jgi:hypothetical protein
VAKTKGGACSGPPLFPSPAPFMHRESRGLPVSAAIKRLRYDQDDLISSFEPLVRNEVRSRSRLLLLIDLVFKIVSARVHLTFGI